MARQAQANRAAVANRASMSSTQNYVLDNRVIEGANWANGGGGVRVGGQADPFGGVEACLVHETAAVTTFEAVANGALILSPGKTEPVWCCGSAYLKASGQTFGSLDFDGGGDFQIYATFNLTTGATTVPTATNVVEAHAFVDEDLGAGWLRVAVIWYANRFPSGGIFLRLGCTDTNGALHGYLGDVTKGVVAYAPAFCFANRPGPRTNTSNPLATITTPIRNAA